MEEKNAYNDDMMSQRIGLTPRSNYPMYASRCQALFIIHESTAFVARAEPARALLCWRSARMKFRRPEYFSTISI